LIIKHVILVEGLKHNLLSINQLFDRGLQVNLSDSVSRRTLLVGKRVNNVYMLNISGINSSLNCLLSKSDESWL